MLSHQRSWARISCKGGQLYVQLSVLAKEDHRGSYIWSLFVASQACSCCRTLSALGCWSSGSLMPLHSWHLQRSQHICWPSVCVIKITCSTKHWTIFMTGCYSIWSTLIRVMCCISWIWLPSTASAPGCCGRPLPGNRKQQIRSTFL